MSSAMRPIVAIGVVFLAMAVVVGFSQWRASHAREVIPWRPDLATTQTEARKRHKAVFAYFTASWCGPCQQMKSTTWADNAVKGAMEKFVPVKIDVDASRALAEQYRVDGIPAFFVIAETGQVLRRSSGFKPPEEMIAWLEQ